MYILTATKSLLEELMHLVATERRAFGEQLFGFGEYGQCLSQAFFPN
jgi:hypothetical protein